MVLTEATASMDKLARTASMVKMALTVRMGKTESEFPIFSSMKTVTLSLHFRTEAQRTQETSTVTGDDLYKTVTSNFTNTLVGKLSGLIVKEGTGEIGTNNAQYLVRGMGSFGIVRFGICHEHDQYFQGKKSVKTKAF